MNYREQVTDEVDEQKERTSSDNEDSYAGRGFSDLEQIEVDMGETPFVKLYPTTAIEATFPEDEGNPVIRFDRESNNGHDHQGDIGLVVDDLSVDTSEDGGFDLSESSIVETDDDDYTEYRVVNYNDESTSSKFDGEAVNIDGDQYGVESEYESLDERVIVLVDRTSAVSVAKKIDVCGGELAGMDPDSPDDINSGLIERPPRDVDAEVGWRYARRPEVREELLGGEITLLTSRREEIDSGGTGYIGENGQHDEPVVGFGDADETHTNPNDATYEELTQAVTENDVPEARGMMWYSVFDEDGTALEPVEGESTNRPFLEWSFDPTAGYLPTEQAKFVNAYQSHGEPTDEDSIVETIEQNVEEGKFEDDPNTEQIVGLIQSGTTIEDPQ